ERLPLIPPFRWRLAEVPFDLDYDYWLDDPDFDIDFHVRELALPPGASDEKLGEQVSRIFARPLDRSRPLWELYLIHGLPRGRVALLTKIHHSVVDGVSGNEVLTILLDESPEGREIPPPEKPSAGERTPSELGMLLRGVAGIPRQPLRALRALPTALPNLPAVPGMPAIPGVPRRARGLSRGRGLVRSDDGGVRECTSARPPRTCFH